MGLRFPKTDTYAPGLRFLSEESALTGPRHWRGGLGHRQVVPTCRVCPVPLARGGQRARRASTVITGAMDHRLRRHDHQRAQEGGPHPLVDRQVAGKLRGEQPFLYGGARLRESGDSTPTVASDRV